MPGSEWKRNFELTEGANARIVFGVVSDNLSVLDIDIKSNTIPDFVSGNFDDISEIYTVNICFEGRCEVTLKNGDCTYLSAGEFSVDAGNTGRGNSAFYYPVADYRGVEVLVLVKNGESLPDFKILGECKKSNGPLINDAGEELLNASKNLSYDLTKRHMQGLCRADAERILYLLEEISSGAGKKREYFTRSQAEIAKKTMEIISADLSQRHPAEQLASQFGISVTSLKNYFKGVYGIGYGQYQKDIRMKEAARLLKCTRQPVGQISEEVGFSNQSKFGKAFKDYWNLTPLEYRRRNYKEAGK